MTRDARKARPGPRERQRMRREAEAGRVVDEWDGMDIVFFCTSKDI